MAGPSIPPSGDWGPTLAAWRSRRLIGPFQQLVLLALMRLGPHCDARSVHGFIEQWTGRETSITAVHTTLQRLQRRGMSSSWKRPPTSRDCAADRDRAGPRWEYRGTLRYHSATTLGWRALRRTLRAEDVLRPGLPGLGREAERFTRCGTLAEAWAAALLGPPRRERTRRAASRPPRERVRSRILGAPMHMPRVDVLMPVRCARETLPEAVADALGQSGVEVRLVAIVDVPDGGDDGTAEWLAEHARGEPRLTVLQGQGRGVGAALDVGLAAVEAPWLAHMEADDRTQPDRLRRQWEALTAVGPGEAPLAAVTCRVAQVGARTPGMARYLGWQNGLLSHEEMARERWIEIPALHQTGLYRTDAVRACGGYAPRGPWPADIDFWFRWFEGPDAARRTLKLPRSLYHWRQHGGQSTRGAPTHTLAALREAKAHYLARHLQAPESAPGGAPRRAPRAVHLLSTGGTLEGWEHALRRAGAEVAARSPWRPGEPLPASVRASRDGGALLVAAYGRPEVRTRVRAALARDGPPLTEPDELLFTA